MNIKEIQYNNAKIRVHIPEDSNPEIIKEATADFLKKVMIQKAKAAKEICE